MIELRDLGHTLHVATSKAEVYARRIITHFGLDPYFASVNGSELDGTRANKADLIAHILEREKIDLTDVAMIGDRDIDIEVDGGVTADNAADCAAAGANFLVAGSAVFKGGPNAYAKNIEAIRRAALIARGEMV